MDRRTTPANARAAHDSLRGQIEAPRFTAGEPAQVSLPLVDLLAAPGGARDRQLLLGDGFLVIDRHEGFAFGRAEKDGFCGYVAEAALAAPGAPTHWVAAPATHLYSAARVQAPERAGLSFGARLTVTGAAGIFSETTEGHVPTQHLRPLGEVFADPVEAAMLFLGTPYLWGGNSRSGIDCSGLVQAALLACGIACPGDSDLQQAIGEEVAEAELRRGDLLFWKGHVAMIVDATRMIHATGQFMQVVVEETRTAIDRIAAQDAGPVIARRRPR
ncbi:NLP/P60 hydrolase [Cereibacter changlensis JA139]|uniref:NLP/P60 hydrolase n=2 Tax=Cereibacter changlensis TaxID=402884 RepID=A0A2T4JY54_9RHOB|nr:C40 family peptidase [Cereibacter changlensis]PTE22851.1 NLP/P60 hydrolase [Cereibacter changlensis JA139]PZX58787.1 cell wall-associated NlpC family hydrolase [Cereibacter changlensis]